MAADREDTESAAGPPGGQPGPSVLGFGLVALWTYVCFVFLYGGRFFGLEVGMALAGLLFVAGCAFFPVLPRLRLVRRSVSPETMLNTGLALGVSVLTVVVADIAYTAWANVEQHRMRVDASEEVRAADLYVWHGELMPRQYHPTSRRFFLYKPNSLTAAWTRGEFYNPAMLRSPTLVDSVLEPRRVSYVIGQNGLRDTTSLAAARIFALGDSFVFGYATDGPDIWPEVLSGSIGSHVYNLGVSNSGPQAQLMLLQHLLETQPDSMRVERLLWMIFEGNDLENDFAEMLPATPRSASSPLEGTVAQAIASLPGRLRNQSIIRRARDGELTVTRRTSVLAADPHREVDGVRLQFPLHHSERWGHKLFSPADVERATKPLEYVMTHPNRPPLDRTFEEMRALGAAHGFEVMVIVAPSAARLYGQDFEGLPRLSTEAHFANYVIDLAERQGFAVLNLVEAMRPFARSELLYYRDDHHWNPRGNQIAAMLIRRALADTAAALR